MQCYNRAEKIFSKSEDRSKEIIQTETQKGSLKKEKHKESKGCSAISNGLTKMYWRDFPGGPVAKTAHSQYRGARFNPWSGN